MSVALPNVKKWHVKPTEFAPVTTPDYSALNEKPINVPEQVAMMPTEDVRYPWYAAVMNDCRYATDYRNHCSVNVPVGSQNKTREWMVHNAEKIIDVSRRRMAERSGYADIYKVPRMPEEYAVRCDPYQCQRRPAVDGGWAIGDGRPNPVPHLFGTYAVEPSLEQQLGQKRCGLTTNYEGGRNTPSRMRVLVKN
jgi:hypothetical protein